MQPSSRSGFTLLEIVSVLAILGIAAFFAVSAFMGNDAANAYIERDRLASSLVHARARGMAAGGGQCVTITTEGVGFSMKDQTQQFSSLLKAYTFLVKATNGAHFCFDAAGAACTSASLIPHQDTGILYCSASTGQTNIGFGSGVTLTLLNETGFVQ